MATYEADLATANTSSATQDVMRGHISNIFTCDRRRVTEEGADILHMGAHRGPLSYARRLRIRSTAKYRSPRIPGRRHPNGCRRIAFEEERKKYSRSAGGGFRTLSKALKASRITPMPRPKSNCHSNVNFESRPFAFPFSVPYLNLDEPSQLEILTQLQEIAALFSDTTVVKVRNATMHGNNEFPSTTEIALALEKVGNGRRILSDAGLFPQVYSLFVRSHGRIRQTRDSIRQRRPVGVALCSRLAGRGGHALQTFPLSYHGRGRFRLGWAHEVSIEAGAGYRLLLGWLAQALAHRACLQFGSQARW